MSFRLKYLCISILNAILATALVIKLSVYPQKILLAILLFGVILGISVHLVHYTIKSTFCQEFFSVIRQKNCIFDRFLHNFRYLGAKLQKKMYMCKKIFFYCHMPHFFAGISGECVAGGVRNYKKNRNFANFLLQKTILHYATPFYTIQCYTI